MIRGTIKFRTGDALSPTEGGMIIIPHVVNDIGAWGAGFVVAISKRWKKPEEEYRKWFRSKNDFKLGSAQAVRVQSETIIMNCIAQHGIGIQEDGSIPLKYDALALCLEKVAKEALDNGARIVMPRIGCGLAQGDWVKVEQIIIDKLCNKGINVFVYDLPEVKI